MIINQCLDQGTFPNSVKLSKVVPIYKKGDNALPSSYRPLSLVPVLSKVFETLIALQLIEHFTMTGVFFRSQYAYIHGKNTIQAV